MIADKTSLGEYPKSLIKAMDMDFFVNCYKPVIEVDFPIIEICSADRKTVAETFDVKDYPPEFADYIVVAHIVESGDKLIVPKDYRWHPFTCKTSIKQVKRKVNSHAELVQLINGEKNGAASKAG